MKTRPDVNKWLSMLKKENRVIKKWGRVALCGLALPLAVYAAGPAMAPFDATIPFEPIPTQGGAIQGFAALASDPVLSIGRGFDSNREAIKTLCLQGTTYYDGTSYGDLLFEHSLSNQQNENFTSVALGGGYKSSVFKINAETSFQRGSSVNTYSDVYLFRYVIKLNNQIFAPSGLNSVGLTSLNTSTTDFLKVCGDKYNDQREVGGALFYSVKLEFANETEKKAFNLDMAARGGVVGRWNAHAEIKKTTDNLKLRGSVTIRAIQAGGDPRKLGSIMGAPPGATEAPVLTCSFSNLTACDAMMQVINNYAADSVAGFPSQITAIDPTSPVGSSILGNHLLGYDAAGVLLTPDVLPLEVRQARDSLAQQLKQSVDDELRAVRVLNSFTIDLTQAKIDALTQTVIDLQINQNALRTSGQFCFDFWQQCLLEVASLYLRPIDRAVLEVPLPTSIVTGYSNYNGTVHYSNGVGQYWPVRTAGFHMEYCQPSFRPSAGCPRLGGWRIIDVVPIEPVNDSKKSFRQLNSLELIILPNMTKGLSLYVEAGILISEAKGDPSIFLPACNIREFRNRRLRCW